MYCDREIVYRRCISLMVCYWFVHQIPWIEVNFIYFSTFFFSIRRLPCTWQLKVTISIYLITLLTLELISIFKMILGLGKYNYVTIYTIAGRLADWLWVSLIPRLLLYFSDISNLVCDNFKPTIRNIDNLYIYAVLVSYKAYTYKKVRQMKITMAMYQCTSLKVSQSWMAIIATFLLLSPISKLPCMLQPAKVVTTQWNVLLRKELKRTSKIGMG